MELELFLFAVLAAASCLSSSKVHAQDQSGFISIDCGITEGSSYKDKITGLRYISDENYTDAGVNKDISPKINTTGIDKQYLNLRSFPDGNKICYTLKPLRRKNKYLIRAGFLYGNYDELDDVPRFDLYLGVNWWATVTLTDASDLFTTEIVHLLSSDSIDICLVNTGFGTPFISVLELRLLDDKTYSNVSQLVRRRVGCGLDNPDSIRTAQVNRSTDCEKKKINRSTTCIRSTACKGKINRSTACIRSTACKGKINRSTAWLCLQQTDAG